MRYLLFCLFFFCVVLTCGCGSQKGYAGPTRSDTALVRSYGITITDINGISGNNGADSVVVAPGPNVIRFTLNRSNYRARSDTNLTFEVRFNALPNREYVLGGPPDGGALCAWEVNPDTGVSDYRVNAGCSTGAAAPTM